MEGRRRVPSQCSVSRAGAIVWLEWQLTSAGRGGLLSATYWGTLGVILGCAAVAGRMYLTERRRADALSHLSATVEQSPLPIFITGLTGVIGYVNPAFCAETGYAAGEVLGRTPDILSGGAAAEYASLWDTVKSGKSWRGTMRNKRKDGALRWVETTISPIHDANGDITQFVWFQQDVTARKETEDRVHFLALHDTLTGLPNRRLCRDKMARAMRLARLEQAKVVLMFLDLDGFKYVNDTFGHTAGDALLSHVAQRLRNCVRETDSVARHGGDEFLITLTDVRNSDMIVPRARLILEQLARPFFVGGQELSVSGSLGIAIYPDDGKDWETLLRKADLAMYAAKEAGRNRYRFFNEAASLALSQQGPPQLPVLQ